MREYSDILGPVDSAFYYVERRETPMNIGALALFEGQIDYGDLLTFIEGRIHQAPRYQQRVIQAAGNLGQPTWIADPDFYVGNHVKLMKLEPPVTEDHLHNAVGKLLSRTLDRSKPLWEVYLIQGLDNQTAVFFKVHHCMVDGLAAVELFNFLMDPTPDYELPKAKQFFQPPPLPDQNDLLFDSILRDIPHQLGLLSKLGKETLRLTSSLTDSDKRLKMLLAVSQLISDNLRPIKKLPINGKNSGSQTMVWAEFSLDDIHAIRARCLASVNDVMLAILAKAIERYTMARGGTTQPFLRILIPVNVRDKEEQNDYGNRISVLPIDVPFNIPDPLEFLTTVTRFTQIMKESSLAYSMDLILTLPSLIPAPVQATIWNMAPTAFSLLAHTWCTNVAAMPTPVYLLGHELKHVYGFFPLNPSMGLACVVVSYNGRITMTLVADKGIVDDYDELLQHAKDAFHALKRAAGVPIVSPPGGANLPEQPVTGTLETPKPENVAISTNGDGSSSDSALASSLAVQPVLAPILIGVPAGNDGAPTKADSAPAPASAAPPLPAVYKLFSEEWAKALQEVINHSVAYRRASTGWTAGALSFIMETTPQKGFDTPAAVLLDLHRGECRSAHSLPLPEALRAAFVIQGSYNSWMDVLKGRSSPLVMLTSGRLHLRKGSMLRLLPYTRSATELVHCAQRVPWE
jgi:WS/DGAT/MGAT family acyltransferase